MFQLGYEVMQGGKSHKKSGVSTEAQRDSGSVHQVIQTVTNALMGIAAVVIAGLAIQSMNRQTGDDPPLPGTVGEARPDSVVDWRAWANRGHELGTEGAPVQIVVFSDYQCGFCAQAHTRLTDLLADHGDLISLRVRHLPLRSIHPHAFLAAVAAECAADQSRFAEMHGTLLAYQDSIPHRRWAWFAQRAGIVDSSRFNACMNSQRTSNIVHQDLLVAAEYKIASTPTYIINGRLISAAENIADLVTAALSQAQVGQRGSPSYHE